jgi:hypothetical protein
MGYWWVELGGEQDSIRDTERVRDDLLKIVFGLWDHIKNRCAHSELARNWALDWIQFLPAKRESRRYVGAHVLTQNDIASGGKFDDLVAYGGWSMDDHHPAGFQAVKIGAPATIFHPAPCPYGIPYRSLYSRHVPNLMFAGRDASCTHAAMSSTRVMGTGCSMGQAVGTAAALVIARGIGPAAMLAHMAELQQTLLRDDAYLPGVRQIFAPAVNDATLTTSRGDPEVVRNGINRPVGEDVNGWVCRPDDWISYNFRTPSTARHATLILDSGLDQQVALSYHQRDEQLTSPPEVMPKVFQLEGLKDGKWQILTRVERNYQRLCRLPLPPALEALRFRLIETWGAEESRLYAFYVE